MIANRMRWASGQLVAVVGALLLMGAPSRAMAQCTPPSIERHPLAQVVMGRNVSFDVQAQGTELIYHWMRDGKPLVEGDRITGSNTAILQIAEVNADDAGAYSVRVTNACGELVSEPAALVFCLADWNFSGEVNSQDFFAFIEDFFTCPECFQDRFQCDPCVTSEFFFDFLQAFFNGC